LVWGIIIYLGNGYDNLKSITITLKASPLP